MTPLFSVVIPTYNRSDLVVKAVQSVLAQTLDDFEVVVSDNQSTDDTHDALAKIHDARLRYVSTPRHMVLPDSWEFARNEGHGKLVMVLSDDDAMVPTTLERFVGANEKYDADFLFCTMAEYRDGAFPPGDANTLDVPAHTDSVRVVDRDLYLNRLMAFHPKYNTHPSGYVFESRLAKAIADRNDGRFFQTLGVEYFAWPVAAVLARNIVNIDVPLVIVGRTSKSWGTNMVLTNPGEGKINQFLSDAYTERRYTPLTNFTFNNLAIEGLLTAVAAFPDEFAPYPVDLGGYVSATRAELERRAAQNVDVSSELEELDTYVAAHPEISIAPPLHKLRGIRTLPSRVAARLRQQRVIPQAKYSGDVHNFDDALGAAEFLASRSD
jgi:glycosyltransferase involved in cell wall biosynthesis